MNRLLSAAVALAVAALVPAALAASRPHSLSGAAEAGPDRPVLPASGLVVRPVVDTDGRNAGRVDALVIDPANGMVEYVLLEGRGGFNLNGELIALPWSMLQPPTLKDPIRLTISRARLENAPRITRDKLVRLTAAPWRSRVYGYFGASYPNKAAAERPPLRHPAPTVDILVMQNGGLAALVEQRPEAAPVRPEAATIATSTDVFTANGIALGHIVQILVDTRSGRVAVARIGKSGMLGVPPVVYPLPIEALRWSGYRDGFQLIDSPRLLAHVPATPLARTHLALAISERNLAQLYRDFDVPPFWTKPAPATAGKAAVEASAAPLRSPGLPGRP